eukprot:3896213-Amphidinium_carterae.1
MDHLGTHGRGEKILDVQQLLSLTIALSTGCERPFAGEVGNSSAKCLLAAPSLLSIPLVATLLGLNYSLLSASCAIPAGFQAAWPSALTQCGELSMADLIDSVAPGMVQYWLSSWPKILCYMQGSAPLLSDFILALLLELAKHAMQSGSVHEKAFAQ